jgi:hypothetical protein
MNENAIGSMIVERAVHLHQALRPGLLESAYEVGLDAAAGKAGSPGKSMGNCNPFSVPFWLCERKRPGIPGKTNLEERP